MKKDVRRNRKPIKRKSKLKRRNPRWYFYLPFWLLIIGMFSALTVMQMSRFEGYRQQLDRLEAELTRERQAGADLRYRQAFYASDAYIERLARERLGFVRQDEILFQNIAE